MLQYYTSLRVFTVGFDCGTIRPSPLIISCTEQCVHPLLMLPGRHLLPPHQRHQRPIAVDDAGEVLGGGLHGAVLLLHHPSGSSLRVSVYRMH